MGFFSIAKWEHLLSCCGFWGVRLPVLPAELYSAPCCQHGSCGLKLGPKPNFQNHTPGVWLIKSRALFPVASASAGIGSLVSSSCFSLQSAATLISDISYGSLPITHLAPIPCAADKLFAAQHLPNFFPVSFLILLFTPIQLQNSIKAG